MLPAVVGLIVVGVLVPAFPNNDPAGFWEALLGCPKIFPELLLLLVLPPLAPTAPLVEPNENVGVLLPDVAALNSPPEAGALVVVLLLVFAAEDAAAFPNVKDIFPTSD